MDIPIYDPFIYTYNEEALLQLDDSTFVDELRKHIKLAYQKCLQENKIRDNPRICYNETENNVTISFLRFTSNTPERRGDALVFVDTKSTLMIGHGKSLGTYKGVLSRPVWIVSCIFIHLYWLNIPPTMIYAVLRREIRNKLACAKIREKYLTYSNGLITESTDNIHHNISCIQLRWRYRRYMYKEQWKKLYKYVLIELRCKPNVGIDYFKDLEKANALYI